MYAIRSYYAAPDEVVRAIRTVCRGEVFLYPSLASRLVQDYLRQAEIDDTGPVYDDLTDREREVLTLVPVMWYTAALPQHFYAPPPLSVQVFVITSYSIHYTKLYESTLSPSWPLIKACH